MKCTECENRMTCSKVAENGCISGLPYKTNGDKIRAMNDEELADWLHNFDSCKFCLRTEDECCTASDCAEHSKKIMLDWLQLEVEE